MSTSSSSGSGIGICTVLFIVFLVLKLCNQIDWSWWWVTAPLWMPVGLAAFVICVVVLLAVCAGGK